MASCSGSIVWSSFGDGFPLTIRFFTWSLPLGSWSNGQLSNFCTPCTQTGECSHCALRPKAILCEGESVVLHDHAVPTGTHPPSLFSEYVGNICLHYKDGCIRFYCMPAQPVQICEKRAAAATAAVAHCFQVFLKCHFGCLVFRFSESDGNGWQRFRPCGRESTKKTHTHLLGSGVPLQAITLPWMIIQPWKNNRTYALEVTSCVFG